MKIDHGIKVIAGSRLSNIALNGIFLDHLKRKFEVGQIIHFKFYNREDEKFEFALHYQEITFVEKFIDFTVIKFSPHIPGYGILK